MEVQSFTEQCGGAWRQCRDEEQHRAVQLIDTLAISEFIAGDWVRHVGGAQHPGGIAISGRRGLVGGNRCDDEAVAYEKGADGIWAISGRIDGAAACNNNGVAIDLNYDNALVRMAGNEVRAYRAAAGSWPQTASFQIPAVAGTTFTPMALQKSTAVSPGSAVFHRAGTAMSYRETASRRSTTPTALALRKR
jgi:hypothetical protein